MFRSTLQLRECANALRRRVNEEDTSVQDARAHVKTLIELKKRFIDMNGGRSDNNVAMMRIIGASLSELDDEKTKTLVRASKESVDVVRLLPMWKSEAKEWMTTRARRVRRRRAFSRRREEMKKMRDGPFRLEADEEDDRRATKERECSQTNLAMYLIPMGSLRDFHNDPYASKLLGQDTNAIFHDKGDIVKRVRAEKEARGSFYMRRHPPSPTESKMSSTRTLSKRYSDLTVEVSGKVDGRHHAKSDHAVVADEAMSTSAPTRSASPPWVSSIPRRRSSPSSDLRSSARWRAASSSSTESDLRDRDDVHIECAVGSNDEVDETVSEILTAMKMGVRPQAVDPCTCTGGAYFLRNRRHRIAGVFKPADEEPYAPHNPREKYRRPSPTNDDALNKSHVGMKRGILVGETAGRECAAYLLDHDGFAGVPTTAIVSVRHPRWTDPDSGEPYDKIGSLQSYVQHFCSAEDVGHSRFQVDDVHRIAILDMRLLNCDRHPGNILVSHQRPHAHLVHSARGKTMRVQTKSEPLQVMTPTLDSQGRVMPTLWNGTESGSAISSSMKTCPTMRSSSYEDYSPTKKQSKRGRDGVVKLVPIDHGFCLPRINALGDASFEWLRWSQAKRPFSSEMLRYIKRLNAERDVDMLRRQTNYGRMRICNRSLLTLMACTTWLQHAAEAGRSPYEIGRTMTRGESDAPSELERAVETSARQIRVDLNQRGLSREDMAAFMAAFEGITKEQF